MQKNPKPLTYHSLKVKLDPAKLRFKTTRNIKTLNNNLGQKRALAALDFGIGIKSHGYNIYAMGPIGIGKRALINKLLKKQTAHKPTPPDWCYIYNFESPQKPIAVQLPAGRGFIFQQDMKKLVDELAANIAAMFESDEYQRGMKRINVLFDQKQKKSNLNRDKSRIKINRVHHLYKEKHEKERNLQIKLTRAVVAPLIKKLIKKYLRYEQIKIYLHNMQQDIIEYVNDFIKQDETTNVVTFSLENPSLTKYKINLLIDNRHTHGAPIIYADNPAYSNLICRVEHTADQGVMTTNFTLIRPGFLHLANGGYLIIEARKLKKNKEAWEALKNALYTNEIKIESIEDNTDTLKPVSLDPAPIPIAVKVILLGSRNRYYTLTQHDPDFSELFKVPVDFDEQITRNNKNIKLYARLIGTIIKEKQLRPLHVKAVAKVIDYSSRLAEDNEKLSTHLSYIKDLLVEANYWTGRRNKKIVHAVDVTKAIQSQIYRMDRARELYQEDINRGFIIIKTDGKVTGQVNCLSVRRVGNFSYGHPTRVTARVRQGNGKFIDIQREIRLAGPMHNKAGLIISNFFASRFNHGRTFSLSASISFEQVYCWTDGDSASIGELCALLSALARVPIKQSLAITGSIDQNGKVQAVGGLNEKIEGFYDICAAKGLNGKQGVIIPSINVKNLILRDDVLTAIKNKQFILYAIDTADQAISLLTGLPAGKIDKSGYYPRDSVYYRVENQLRKYSQNVNQLPLKNNAPK